MFAFRPRFTSSHVSLLAPEPLDPLLTSAFSTVPTTSPWFDAVARLVSDDSALASSPGCVPASRLNSYFSFVSAFNDFDSLSADFPVYDDKLLLVRPASLSHLLCVFNHFTREGYERILKCLGRPVGRNATKERLLRNVTLLQSTAPPLMFLFRSVRQKRRSMKDSASHPCDPRPAQRLLKAKLRLEQSTPAAEARKSDDARRHKTSYAKASAASKLVAATRLEEIRNSFPQLCGDDLKATIISDFQSRLHPSLWSVHPCAVCQVSCHQGDFDVIKPDLVDFSLLRNPDIPSDLLPDEYDRSLYSDAILYPPGMLDTHRLAPINMCKTCSGCLLSDPPVLPEFCLANGYYFARDRLPPSVKAAFAKASPWDLTLVSRARSSVIIHRFSENRSTFKGDPSTSQYFSRGNTVILPQDPSGVRSVLPPSPDDIASSICALFVGRTQPTPDNIAQLSPVLVSKSVVKTVVDFLLEHNPYYHSGTSFSQANFDALFSPELASVDTATLASVEKAFLAVAPESESASADYTDRNNIEDGSLADPLLLESVGYTEGDHTPQNYSDMKIKAINHCRKGLPFLQSRSGAQPMSDRDEAFLTSVFPHLDPWGIAPLNSRKRSNKSSLKRQVQYLLSLHHSPFERDANFAFICWNIITKAEVNKTVSFRVKDSQRTAIVNDIMNLSTEALDSLASKWEKDPSLKPSTTDEKAVARVLNRLRHVSGSLTGSDARKRAQRNEIRGLMNVEGTPALFITLNPADVHHPLVRLISGHDATIEDLLKGEPLSKRDRALLVADRPAAAATFFDAMIRTFIDCVLRPGNGPGLFGTCTSYYGTVEAQGKGTLHLHLLIWLEGNLNPQALRDRMAVDTEFSRRMIQWLEANILTAAPGINSVVQLDRPYKPALPKGDPHPSAYYMTQISDYPDRSMFWKKFNADVKALAQECNWHTHTFTCWKYSTKGEKRDDEHCRMGHDGKTRPQTVIDDESGSIVLRKLHPWINNYNDVVTFLMQCNTDIKYIGSGEAAKALVYYITDYITKSPLPLHVGVSALSYAIRKNDEKFSGSSDSPSEVRSRSLLIKSVNAMMGRLEISHQQVMSYLVGGGDHYTNQTFRILYWGDFDRFIRSCNTSAEEVLDPDEVVPAEVPDVVMSFSAHSLTASNQIYDYRYRPSDDTFEALCLWDMVATTEKISRLPDDTRALHRGNNKSNAGRPPLQRGDFCSALHPQAETHRLRLRSRLVPVVLGPTIPNPDKNSEARESWARAMLILFKPWRHSLDLKHQDQTWLQAFNEFTPPANIQQIIANMNVQSECKDARDTYSEGRRTGRIQHSLLPGVDLETSDAVDSMALEDALLGDENLDDDASTQIPNASLDSQRDVKKSSIPEDVGNAVQLLASRISLSTKTSTSTPSTSGLWTGSHQATSDDLDTIASFNRQMKALKKASAPGATDENGGLTDDDDSESEDFFPHLQSSPDVTIETLGQHKVFHHVFNGASTSGEAILLEIESIVDEFHLRGNAEQERAFRIIAEHFVKGSEEQLLMYMGGIGGTGKSHVISAIVELFTRCGMPDALLLSAPTGIAAVLINGYTIHSLTFLPKSQFKPNITKLQSIWKSVVWLVIDEISMIPSKLLSQISHQISIAKGDSEATRDKPFGGVNLIFSGDFGQLKPVRMATLFSNDLRERITASTVQTIQGQEQLYGAYLWRLVGCVVELKKNWRQLLDPRYGNLVSRVRSGTSWQGRTPHRMNQIGSGSNYTASDWEVLLSRTIEHLSRESPTTLQSFSDAPFIVTKKIIRDHLNAYRVKEFAGSIGHPFQVFTALDFCNRKPVKGEQRQRLLRLPASKTQDALSLLPLVPGMKVMVTENVLTAQKVVNGAEGTLLGLRFEVLEDGQKTALCAYVQIPGSNVHPEDTSLPPDVVVIVPTFTTFKYESPQGFSFNIRRRQLPLLPAYAFTDYKSQGQTLERAIIDLDGCKSLQSMYVMLSRVKTLKGLAILRWFPSNRLYSNLQQDWRDEFARLSLLDVETKARFDNRVHLQAESIHPSIIRAYKKRAETAM